MKKKICIILVSIISVLCLAFGLSACTAKVEFKVSFVVDGQTVHTIDTNGNEIIAMPPDPQKDDYIFDGWYWDKDVWGKPFTANSLLDAPLSSNMSVYCKWRPEHEHAFTKEVIEDKYKASGASCTEKSKYYYSCECGEKGTQTFEYGELLQHAEETITGKAATCTKTGLTDGKKCSVCSKVLVEQTTIPVKEHTEETVTGKAATCTENGLTDGKKCSVCQTTLVEQETIPAAHVASAWIIDKNSTCTEKGSRHKECVVCESVLTTEEIALAPHTETTIYGKVPTCTDSGLTNGRVCSVCGTTTAEQTIILATGHKYDNGVCLSCGAEQAPATISEVKGGTINDLDIYMFVEHDVTEVNLLRIVTCSPKSTWKLYEDKRGQHEIATKIASGDNDELNDGNNVFYIVATSANGIDVNTYTLTIYRSYEISISYYAGDTVIKTEKAFTGHEFSTNYTPEIVGYTFNYWKNGDEMFTNAVLWNNLDLQADKAARTYQVTFITDEYAEAVNAITATYDQEITLPASSKTCYTFNGWLDGGVIVENTFVWQFAQDKEYTAKFTPTEYDITYVLNGGTLDTEVNSYHIEQSVNFDTPERVAYDFAGWYDNAGLTGTAVTVIALGNHGDKTFYAKWTPIIYNISYDSNGGTFSTSVNTYHTEQAVDFDVPEKDYYDFAGWYDNAGLTGTVVTGMALGNYGDKTYYAKWTPHAYPITYNLNGGTIETEINSYNIEHSVTFDNPARTDYTFMGWYLDEEFSIHISGIETGNYGDKELYAKWQYGTEGLQYTLSGKKYSVSGYNGNASEVKIPSEWNDCPVVTIGNSAFSGCSGLTSITIPNSVKSIGSGVFSGCSNLTSITLPFVGNSVKTSSDTYQYPLGYIFGTSSYTGGLATQQDYFGSSTSSVTSTTYYIPSSLREVTITGGEILYGAFEYCSGLTSVTIGNSVTSIGGCVFYGCSGLTSITIPNSVTSIGGCVFYGCSGLTSITIPNRESISDLHPIVV